MSDYLLTISKNRTLSQVIRTLGLPIPLPTSLRRAEGAWPERSLEGRTVAVAGVDTGHLSAAIASALTAAGATLWVAGAERGAGPYVAAGEAWARPVRVLPPVAPPEDTRVDALVYDASGIESPDALRGLYEFFQPWIKGVRASGRIVVLGRSEVRGISAAAAAAALEGFVRSLAKEVGRKGTTANLVRVAPGAEARIAGPLRFLLSEHAAFVSGQPWTVSATAVGDAGPIGAAALYGKVAVVTGAARGIGAVTARTLAAEGAHVWCVDRPGEEAALAELAGSIDGSVLALDVADVGAPRTLARELMSRHGGLDILVHNAGVTRDRTLGRMKPDEWDLVLRVNLASVCKITDHLVGEAVIRRGGRLIVISSVSGIAGNAGQTNYAASKAGLVGMVRELSPVLASRGITVNAIAPGFIETQMTAAMPAGIREVARRLSALGQGGLPQDVADAVTFLALPSALGITGSVVRVCGGAFVGA